jgi:hypothetical protein
MSSTPGSRKILEETRLQASLPCFPAMIATIGGDWFILLEKNRPGKEIL